MEAGVVFADGCRSGHPFPAVSRKGQRRQLGSFRPGYRKRTPQSSKRVTGECRQHEAAMTRLAGLLLDNFLAST